METCLTGKTAIVTGSASGIGEATAFLYAELGARIVVSDIDEERKKQRGRRNNKSSGQKSKPVSYQNSFGLGICKKTFADSLRTR